MLRDVLRIFFGHLLECVRVEERGRFVKFRKINIKDLRSIKIRYLVGGYQNSPPSIYPSFDPLNPNIKIQFLLSSPHTFIIAVVGRSCRNFKRIHIG